MTETAIHDRLLAEFRSLHYGRDPGTPRLPVEAMRDLGTAATRAARQLGRMAAAVERSKTKQNQPRDPRPTTKRRRR